MIGILFMGLATALEETATVIGKQEVARKHETMFTMGFLNLFWLVVAFCGIALFWPGAFRFSLLSLPTLLPRLVLEVAQAHTSVRAAVVASRSTYRFLRTITIPLLLAVDIALGYTIGFSAIVGIGIIAVTLPLLFMNHGLDRKGIGLVLFTAVNAVFTISLYKYNIEHFNSVVAEQLIALTVVMAYFFVVAHVRGHEHPLRLLRHPRMFVQSATMGISSGLESFAYLFAPASIILAAKRSAGILWAFISGTVIFHERHRTMKAIGCGALIVGLILLAR